MEPVRGREPLQAKDRVFLRDFTEYSYLNHYMAALSFWQLASCAAKYAVIAHRDLELIDDQTARERASQLGTATRIQRIAVLRIYAEYVAACEDFGALMFAIRNRRRGDMFCIFERYIKSTTADVGNFYDYSIKEKAADLDVLLRLPKLEKVRKLLPHDDATDIEKHYHAFADDIRGIAEKYRLIASNAVAAAGDVNKLDSNWCNDAWLVLDLVPRESNPTRPGSSRLMTEAYNKIKHRFSAIELLSDFLKAEPTDNILFAAHHDCRPEASDKLIKSIAGLTTRAVEIAAVLLRLDEYGLI